MNRTSGWGDIEHLKVLKARYCRYCDTKDWENYFSLFADDLVFEISAHTDSGKSEFGNSGRQLGKSNFRAWVTETASHVVTSVHHCHMPEIELLSDVTAKGIWALEDLLYFSDDMPMRSLHGFGHYHETYERVNGVWLFKTLRLTRLKVDIA